MDSTGPNLSRRAARLEQHTVLNEREATVQAGLEHGIDYEYIARDIDADVAAVEETVEGIDEKLGRVRSTVHMISGMGEDGDEW